MLLADVRRKRANYRGSWKRPHLSKNFEYPKMARGWETNGKAKAWLADLWLKLFKPFQVIWAILRGRPRFMSLIRKVRFLFLTAQFIPYDGSFHFKKFKYSIPGYSDTIGSATKCHYKGLSLGAGKNSIQSYSFSLVGISIPSKRPLQQTNKGLSLYQKLI